MEIPDACGKYHFMKHIKTLITILFMSLLSSPSWCEPLPFDELVIREHLFYKKFTNSPFTGEVSGEWFGKL